MNIYVTIKVEKHLINPVATAKVTNLAMSRKRPNSLSLSDPTYRVNLQLLHLICVLWWLYNAI